MKFDNLRVAHKLWGVILGLLFLMLGAALWTQLRSREATDATQQAVDKYEDAITTAVRWRGLAELQLINPRVAMDSIVGVSPRGRRRAVGTVFGLTGTTS